MKLTIDNKRGDVWKSRTKPYITAMFTLVLATGALLGLGGWNDDARTTETVQAAASIPVIKVERPAQRHYVFLVASQQDAIDKAASFYQDLNFELFPDYTFVVVTNAEEDTWARYANTQANNEDVGVNYDLIDLRGR
jgi:hypothetical protein